MGAEPNYLGIIAKVLIATLVIIYAVRQGRKKKAGKVHEASMNFDMEDVKPFLENLAKNTSGMDKFLQFWPDIQKLEVESEKDWKVNIKFEGKTEEVIFKVFMDDIDAPDIYFFSSSKPLIDQIEKELQKFMK